MSIIGIVLLAGGIIFMAIGLPIAFSLGLASAFAITVSERIPLIVVPQRIFTAIDSFPLMAIIFFVIAGELMLQGGISRRLVNFASCFFGWMRGSLSFISFATCAFFGAISGSALATTAAVGGIMYPAMAEQKYEKAFAATVQAVGGTLGILIPPSISLIIYGVLTNTSIGDLFLAIIAGGIMMAVIYMLTGYYIIVKEGMVKDVPKLEINIRQAFFEGFWALLTPVIILGGIYTGVFTPTESAVAACFYAFVIGKFFYGELDNKKLYNALLTSAVTSATIMFLIATAMLFGWVMTIQNIPQMATNLLMSVVDQQFTFLLLVNVLFLIAGMFMETGTILLLMTPLVYPVAVKFGVNPIHFGVLSVINLSIGMVTPPFGASLFVAAGMAKIPIESMFKRAVPFIITGVIGCLIVTYVPGLTLGFLTLIK